MLDLIQRVWKQVKAEEKASEEGKPLKEKAKKSSNYPLSKNEMTQIYVNEIACPDCGKDARDYMLSGPQGGGSINIKCEYCGSFFNDMGPFGLDRIRWWNHHEIINGGNEFNTNYLPFEPYIIQNWLSVCVPEKASWVELYRWCEDNAKGSWSVKAGKMHNGGAFNDGYESTFFFEDEDSAALFKLTFS